MPFIHIKSLPFEQPRDISEILQRITEDFSNVSGIDKQHITVTWDLLSAGHYAVAGEVSEFQPESAHPLLVEMLLPDFNSREAIGEYIKAVAESLSRHAQIPINNLFVNCHLARSGQVFDAGEMVHW
ncbi:MAG: hypothetical protein JAY99_17570 [Candidatus Thiodiazotropha lotti]|uniref:4-oxalocrotonate tautomerase domain-containing protein n=1 Tax=Candidatus Thiodiazotropha endoloripes TaxID=1818881 RepID=A0A1E2UUB0_9GAMM|nr:hypothetical protein [Candidatus Thiodiazotropha endoloripes]MCG7897104.1 hypothetical protein [Candidatus Thiodiazotropha weberae]MCG7991120.1 hypothetical protein [Candidatus Thiodiazotropha lotti]MCG7902933.1 hypothetical protein [Candidatus Thiodiazotropha weberae]MCG7914991.1 hypothetical protein [Candidatus Thiodiazotropha weberae]MCG8001330.1 hypothetical protein [Candidatus Thiodiazotropha lotti]